MNNFRWLAFSNFFYSVCEIVFLTQIKTSYRFDLMKRNEKEDRKQKEKQQQHGIHDGNSQCFAFFLNFSIKSHNKTF